MVSHHSKALQNAPRPKWTAVAKLSTSMEKCQHILPKKTWSERASLNQHGRNSPPPRGGTRTAASSRHPSRTFFSLTTPDLTRVNTPEQTSSSSRGMCVQQLLTSERSGANRKRPRQHHERKERGHPLRSACVRAGAAARRQRASRQTRNETPPLAPCRDEPRELRSSHRNPSHNTLISVLSKPEN